MNSNQNFAKNSTGNMHGRLMAILTKLHFTDDDRHNLVYAWTQGRTQSSLGLTENELRDVIWKLENQFSFGQNPTETSAAIMELALKQKRATVLAIAQRTGIHEGTNFKKFNNFMLNSSILKKKLNKYTLEELDQLIAQFHALEANFKASAQKAYTKAWHKYHNIPETSKN
jgi:hypothetical protein